MSYQEKVKTLQLIKCINPEKFKKDQMLLAKTTTKLLVWKKVHKYSNPQKDYIYIVIPLIIPKNTLIICPRYYYVTKTNKMRANKAISFGNGYSHWKQRFKYTNQTLIKPDSFSQEPHICTHGIHFFLTEKEAQNYRFF